MSHSLQKITSILLLFCLCAALGACGKRASHLDLPDDVADDHFPRVYPDPATDPSPHQ